MNQTNETAVLLIEDDPTVQRRLQLALENRNYKATLMRSADKALEASKNTAFDLIIVGHGRERKDPVEMAKALVMASPMTSIVMVTDLEEKDLHEKVEGYGILGNIKRTVPHEDVSLLMDNYETIHQSLKGG